MCPQLPEQLLLLCGYWWKSKLTSRLTDTWSTLFSTGLLKTKLEFQASWRFIRKIAGNESDSLDAAVFVDMLAELAWWACADQTRDGAAPSGYLYRPAAGCTPPGRRVFAGWCFAVSATRLFSEDNSCAFLFPRWYFVALDAWMSVILFEIFREVFQKAVKYKFTSYRLFRLADFLKEIQLSASVFSTIFCNCSEIYMETISQTAHDCGFSK